MGYGTCHECGATCTEVWSTGGQTLCLPCIRVRDLRSVRERGICTGRHCADYMLGMDHAHLTPM